jgi:hypothetical protein
MPVWQLPDRKQRIKFRRITMPNPIAVPKYSRYKAGLQKIAMSTTGDDAHGLAIGVATVTDENTIQFDSIQPC